MVWVAYAIPLKNLNFIHSPSCRTKPTHAHGTSPTHSFVWESKASDSQNSFLKTTKQSMGVRLESTDLVQGVFLLEWFSEPKINTYTVYIVSTQKSLSFVGRVFDDQRKLTRFWCKSTFICKSYGGFFLYLVMSTYLKTHQGPKIAMPKMFNCSPAEWEEKSQWNLEHSNLKHRKCSKKSQKKKNKCVPCLFSTKASFWGR